VVPPATCSLSPVSEQVSRLRALAHPVRLRLLSLLTGASLSAAEAAREMGLSQANVSYHLRLLERVGLVELAEEVVVRGGRARRYRHVSSSVVGPRTPARRPTAEARQVEDEFVSLLAGELLRRHRLRADGPRTEADAELWVSPEEWERTVDAVHAVSAALHACAVPPRSPGSVRVSMSAALFPMRRR
jgi:DNA-binding transcriptional ArsR family regulator